MMTEQDVTVGSGAWLAGCKHRAPLLEPVWRDSNMQALWQPQLPATVPWIISAAME